MYENFVCLIVVKYLTCNHLQKCVLIFLLKNKFLTDSSTDITDTWYAKGGMHVSQRRRRDGVKGRAKPQVNCPVIDGKPTK